MQRGGSGRGPRADRAPFAGADRRRHPLPVQARARRDGSRCAGVAPQSRQHPQARAHQAGRGRGQGARHPDSHRCERGLARPRDGRAARRHHAGGARRVGDARARPVPRGRLRRREDLGEGVERAVDDRRVPAAVGDDRSSVASRRHRGGPAAAGFDQRGCGHRHVARRRHRRHDSFLAHRRSGRRGQGRAHVARGDGAARAQGPRPDRVPVVRARRSRRDPRRVRRAGRARGAQHPAAGRGDGMRRERTGRGARSRPRHRGRARQGSFVREGPSRARRARGRDGRRARRRGRAHHGRGHRGATRRGRRERGRDRGRDARGALADPGARRESLVRANRSHQEIAE